MIILLSVAGTLFLVAIGPAISLVQDGSVTAGGKCAVCITIWLATASALCFYFAAKL